MCFRPSPTASRARTTALLLAFLSAAAYAQEPPAEPGSTLPVKPVVGQTAEAVTIEIAGYARVEPRRDSLEFVVARQGGEAAKDVVLSYATNRAVGQRLLVSIEGEMEGVRLQIEPAAGAPEVHRVARRGSPGTPVSTSVIAPGEYVLVDGLGQVVATQEFRIVAVVAPEAMPGERTIRLEFGFAD